MRQEKGYKIVYEGDSLALEIDRLERLAGTKKAKFCYLVAGGSSETAAFIETFGYKDRTQRLRMMRGDTGDLIRLLRQECEGQVINGFKMDKVSRLEHLLTTALQAHHAYTTTGEAAHGAVYAKLMTVINTMTGDNAPTQVQHLVSITHEQLNDMSNSERTEAYKRMMSGKLELLEPTTNTSHIKIPAETPTTTEGGDT